MTDGSDLSALKYGAFISYSHRDDAFARRLQRRLETYRLPLRLARRANATDPGSRRLRPIFRDREGFSVAADLSDSVRHALAQSRFLIVVCSPNSATSDWVGLEIEYFRSLRGNAGILAVLCKGTPATAFHPALCPPDADGHGRKFG